MIYFSDAITILLNHIFAFTLFFCIVNRFFKHACHFLFWMFLHPEQDTREISAPPPLLPSQQ